MKRIVVLTLSLMLLLTACGESDALQKAEVITVNTAQNVPGYVPGEDYQQNWNDWGSNIGQLSAASEDGYYYFDRFGDALLHFYDFANGHSVVLCNQPNCDHKSVDCNATVSGMEMLVQYLQFYDGNLYLIGTTNGLSQDVSVWRVSADGTVRGLVGNVMTISNGGSFHCIIHRGYVYCTLGTDEPENNREVPIYRLSLSGDGQAEVIHTFDKAHGAGAFLKAYGNHLYINHVYYTDREGNGYCGDLYRMDIHTGEMDYLTQTPGKPFVVDGDRVYYSGNEQVLTYDLNTGETSVLLDQGPVFLTLDADRLYVDNEFYIWLFADDDYTQRTVTVIDTNTLETLAVFPVTIHNSNFGGSSGGFVLADTTYEYYRGDLTTALSGTEPEWVHINPKTEEGP